MAKFLDDNGLLYLWSKIKNAFVAKEPGKGLSTNDLTAELKTNYDAAYSHSQSAHAPSDAQKNVQADWNETNVNSDAYIKNKPTIPSDVAVDSALSESSENPVQNKVIKAALDGKIDISTKGQPNGVASLGAGGLIPSTQMPSMVTITSLVLDRPSTPVGTAEYDKLIGFKTGGLPRWAIGSNATDESGNDAGSNFVIYKCNDSGYNSGTPLWISRATGVTTFTQTPRVGSNNIWHTGNLPYETGTWTPTLSGATTAGSPTYGTRSATYTRIGDRVFLSGNVSISDKGGMDGDLRLTGFPFVQRAGYNTAGYVGNVGSYSGAKLSLHVDQNSSRATIWKLDTALQASEIGNSFGLWSFVIVLNI